MKVEIGRVEENITEDVKFPAFFVSADSDLIVEFFSEYTGVVRWIDGQSYSDRIGIFGDDWLSCYCSDEWIQMPKGTTITLTQE